MRLRPHEAALEILRRPDLPPGVQEAVPFDRESAVHFLTLFTGQGFGDDVTAWEKWFLDHNSAEYVDRCYLELEAKSRRKC